MLYWPKLLAIAHAISGSVEPYLTLYLWHDRGLNLFAIGMLVALVLILRFMCSAVFIWLVDCSQPVVQLRVLISLTITGTLAFVCLFNVPADDSHWLVILVVCLMLANGLFYQPLAALVDSAMIKFLGDYKVWLYDAERQWGRAASALSVAAIGCISYWIFDNEIHPLLLTCMISTGSGLLLLVLLVVYRRGLDQLEYIEEEEDDDDPTAAPRFLKNAIIFPHHDLRYKPYSLFGEPLSHISEEDASMLQRVGSSNTTAQLMRRNSNHSVNSTTTTASAAALAASGSVPITMYGSTNTTMTTTTQTLDLFSSWRHRNSLLQQQQQLQQQQPPQQQQQSLPPNTNMNGSATELCSSADLSLLPLPPHDTPMSVLLLLQRTTPFDGSSVDQAVQWQIQSMSLTTLILGIVYGMLNTMLFIYMYDVLGMSMRVIGLAAAMPVSADMAVHASARLWVPRFTPNGTIIAVHAMLIICAFTYTFLRPEWTSLWAIVGLLQTLQGAAFPLIWLLIVHRASALLWTEEEQFRIAQIGKLSALYSSIGPATGALLAGFLISGEDDVGSSTSGAMLVEGFTLIFRCTIALTAASFVVSWGWWSSD